MQDKVEDRGKFRRAWIRLAGVDAGAEERVLRGAAELANQYPARPRQLNEIHDVDHLLDEAKAAEEEMHVVMRKLVEGVGGSYDKGPLKKKGRVVEKIKLDYGK